MKLTRKRGYITDFRCDLTYELDTLSKISERRNYSWFHHYIMADDFCKNQKCLAIRVPGGTVGGVWIDDNNVITKIKVSTDYTVKTYPENINELLEKYIGEVIEYQ